MKQTYQILKVLLKYGAIIAVLIECLQLFVEKSEPLLPKEKNQPVK